MTLRINFDKLVSMLAVIKTGGKQYLVSPGDKIKVENLDAKEGENVTFDEVLLCDTSSADLVRSDKLQIGMPLVKDVKVNARVLSHGKNEKVIIFKYKPKKRYRRKIGHRQQFTEVEILEIK